MKKKKKMSLQLLNYSIGMGKVSAGWSKKIGHATFYLCFQGSPGMTMDSIRIYGHYMHPRHAVDVACARLAMTTAITANVSRITKENTARVSQIELPHNRHIT